MYTLALLRPLAEQGGKLRAAGTLVPPQAPHPPQGPAQPPPLPLLPDHEEIAEAGWFCGASYAAVAPHPMLAFAARAAISEATLRGWLAQGGGGAAPPGDPSPPALMAAHASFSPVTKRWANMYVSAGAAHQGELSAVRRAVPAATGEPADAAAPGAGQRASPPPPLPSPPPPPRVPWDAAPTA
jgi:hypothetical protein